MLVVLEVAHDEVLGEVERQVRPERGVVQARREVVGVEVLQAGDEVAQRGGHVEEVVDEGVAVGVRRAFDRLRDAPASRDQLGERLGDLSERPVAERVASLLVPAHRARQGPERPGSRNARLERRETSTMAVAIAARGALLTAGRPRGRGSVRRMLRPVVDGLAAGAWSSGSRAGRPTDNQNATVPTCEPLSATSVMALSPVASASASR